MTKYRLGIDVGGTFTDCIVIDDAQGSVGSIKVPSQPRTPDEGVFHGIERLLADYAIEPAAIVHFGHGTTLATNTVIEENGEQVGLLVTRGFRDVLQLARLQFPEPANINSRLPRRLLIRQDVREVAERMGADGTVVAPLAEDDVIAAVKDLIEARGARAIVVSFIHAYRNPGHEQRAKALIEQHFPGLYVCCSSEIWARPREYERTMVGVLNAYVGRRLSRYFNGLADGVRARGLTVPVLITKSNGGIMNADTAGRYPVTTMLSGPASGVVGAKHVAEQAGHDRIVSWDMGGTSLDLSIIDGRLRYADSTRVGDYPLFLPTVDVLSVGAGGGSLASVDRSGLLHVGPRSAGADPGPACYGRGGEGATLTDAYLTLGVLDPGKFAGGEMQLQPELAERALARLGDRLGTDAIGAAEAMIRVATAQMHVQFMPHAARYGADPSEYTLVPFGGAGPTHAFLFAREAGFQRVLVPLFPGLLCAWGCLIADVRFDVPRSLHVGLDALSEETLNRHLDEMGAEAHRWLDAQGVPVTGVQIVRHAYVRYKGQSFEIETGLPAGYVTRADVRRTFLDLYRVRYGYADPNAPLEIVEILVQGIGTTHKPGSTPSFLGFGRGKSSGESSYRAVHLDGQWQQVPVVDRVGLAPGDRLKGPVVVEQPDTTTYVPAGFRIQVDPFFNLVGERE